MFDIDQPQTHQSDCSIGTFHFFRFDAATRQPFIQTACHFYTVIFYLLLMLLLPWKWSFVLLLFVARSWRTRCWLRANSNGGGLVLAASEWKIRMATSRQTDRQTEWRRPISDQPLARMRVCGPMLAGTGTVGSTRSPVPSLHLSTAAHLHPPSVPLLDPPLPMSHAHSCSHSPLS